MEALDSFIVALEDCERYYLVCLCVIMQVMDGYQAVMGIRNLEKERYVPEVKASKIIIATALNEVRNVKMAF